MRPTDKLQTQGYEDGSLGVRAYVLGNSRTAITQATITSIAAKVFDVTGGTQVGATITIDKTTAVLDTPLSDSDGEYNFDYTVAGTYFPEGSRTYEVEVVFTPASGSPIAFVVEHTTLPLRGS